jgi:DNA-binding MarR family transcriptional regulator
MSFRNPTPEETEARFAALLAGPIVVPPPDEGAAPADLPLLLRLANARVETQIRQATDEAGLQITAAGVHVLRQCRYVGKRVASLAEHLQISRQAAFQIANRLVAAGLVERGSSAHGPVVELTEEGHAVVREVTAVLTDVIEAWLVQLREGRLTQLCADLELLAEPPGARWRNIGG